MFKAYIKFWRDYADFTGKSSRPEHWWAMLCQLIIISPLSVSLMYLLSRILDSIFASMELNENLGMTDSVSPPEFIISCLLILTLAILLTIYILATIIPSCAAIVRRLRDAGFHWAMIFVGFIPYIGFWILLLLLCMPTKDSTPATAQLISTTDSSPEVSPVAEKIITANETNTPVQVIENIADKNTNTEPIPRIEN